MCIYVCAHRRFTNTEKYHIDSDYQIRIIPTSTHTLSRIYVRMSINQMRYLVRALEVGCLQAVVAAKGVSASASVTSGC